jgi:predicted kinase
MEKNLIIVRGIPGSGKSTFARILGRAVCTADDFHTDRNGNYNWKPENVGRAHGWCQRKCERFLKAGIDRVIVANTSTTEDEIRPYIVMAKKYGYRVFSVIVENRHGGINEHNVPGATLEKMEKRFSIKLI